MDLASEGDLRDQRAAGHLNTLNKSKNTLSFIRPVVSRLADRTTRVSARSEVIESWAAVQHDNSWVLAGYQSIPTRQELAQMKDEELEHVSDFRVSNPFGEIHYEGFTDLRDVNIEESIRILPGSIEVYGDTHSIVPVGQKLNKPANLKFFGLHRLARDLEISKILARVEEGGAQLVNFDQVAGTLEVRVPHFTKYQFVDLDAAEDGEQQPKGQKPALGSDPLIRTNTFAFGRPSAAQGVISQATSTINFRSRPPTEAPSSVAPLTVKGIVGEQSLLSKDSLEQIGKFLPDLRGVKAEQSSFVERYQGTRLLDSHLVGINTSGSQIHAAFPINRPYQSTPGINCEKK